ncbi:MAG: hypothetical protein KDJ17_03270 [Hyphomicrobiaceae bacterium]|nr:hypothetical protein [Hyphomicrobiaceae bacterium]
MYYPLSIICFGVALLAMAAGLHFAEKAEYDRRFFEVMRANTTIDPNNPPIIVTEKMGSVASGGVIFRNVGGKAIHTPLPAFTSYEDVGQKIRHDLLWLTRTTSAVRLVGMVLMVMGAAAFAFLLVYANI